MHHQSSSRHTVPHFPGMGLAAGGLSLLLTAGCNGGGGITFDPSVLTVALADPTGDFHTPPGGAPPGGVVPFGPSDLTSIELGADTDYLYVRLTMAGALPSQAVPLAGDQVRGITANVVFDTDQNPNTGRPAEAGAEAHAVYSLRLLPARVSDAYWFAGATGIGDPEDQRYSAHGSGPLIGGGPGSAQVVTRFPLGGLGLVPGTLMNVVAWVGAAGQQWDHLSFDEFGPAATTL